MIEQSTNGTVWVTVVDGVSTATSHMMSGLSNGTAYQLPGRARNVVGDGPWSVAVSATPRTVPSAPQTISAAVAPMSGVGSGEVRLTWSSPSSDGGSPVTDYVIEQSTNGTTWVAVVDGVSTATSYTVSGLSNGTAYQFRVRAQNAVGDGPSSAWCRRRRGRCRWRRRRSRGRLLRCRGSVRVRFA